MPEELLFSLSAADIDIPAREMPGYRAPRVACARCGEGINYHREVERNGNILCIPCAQGGLLAKMTDAVQSSVPSKVVLVVGRKKVGKTTLIENLIAELSRRGYRVSTVKHHHSDLPVEVDKVGSDSWRHRQAGAASVALATPHDLATFRDTSKQLSLDNILAGLSPSDVVLVEGFHDEPRRKIELLSATGQPPLCPSDPNLIAIVTANGHRSALPTFRPDSVAPLADLIEREIIARI
jgi:molybdopterin-guanine dinucleotide biosynthesis protein B